MNLEELDISGNDFRLIPTKLCTLKQLRILKCKENKIRLLPEEMGGMTTLE
eukprot:Pgem_evm1s2728